MENKKGRTVRSSMGILGIMGFLGFLGITLNQPTFCAFFAFFGFFAWYWWGKLAKEECYDERLIENKLKATIIATRYCFGLVFGLMIFSGNMIGDDNPALAYKLLIIIVSLGFAMANNLTAYLTWKYDQED